jgi:DNA-binding MarR family transcriptional regulator
MLKVVSFYSENLRLDEVERALLENVLHTGNLNLSQLSRKLDEPKANVHRRIERLEEERIIESQQMGRQRIISITPAAVDKVRGVLGIVPSARVLVLISQEHALKIIDFFKPHEIYFLTTNCEADLKFENVKKLVLPENLKECYERIYVFVREEKSYKNVYMAIAITGNGIASIAAGMVARDTATPILTVENDEIKQII